MKNIFENKKPIIGMIHLDFFPSQKNFKSKKYVVEKAIKELKIYQNNGVDAVIIENWQDESLGAYISLEDKKFMLEVSEEIAANAKIPIGINVLPNDFKSAFEIAKKVGAAFIQLDVFIDHVLTEYTYSKVEPFEIKLNIVEFHKFRKENNFENIAYIVSVHPKHYKLLNKNDIVDSAIKSEKEGAFAICVTGNLTGNSPNIKDLIDVKTNTHIPTIISSGLNEKNAKQLLKIGDGAIVGTAFKDDKFENVIEEKVKKIMDLIK